jgi:hypothetical protein
MLHVDRQRVLGALLGRCGMNSSSISGLATTRFRIPIRASSCCLYNSMAGCAMRAHQARTARHDARLPEARGGVGGCAATEGRGGVRWEPARRGAGVPRGGAACHSKPRGAQCSGAQGQRGQALQERAARRHGMAAREGGAGIA